MELNANGPLVLSRTRTRPWSTRSSRRACPVRTREHRVGQVGRRPKSVPDAPGPAQVDGAERARLGGEPRRAPLDFGECRPAQRRARSRRLHARPTLKMCSSDASRYKVAVASKHWSVPVNERSSRSVASLRSVKRRRRPNKCSTRARVVVCSGGIAGPAARGPGLLACSVRSDGLAQRACRPVRRGRQQVLVSVVRAWPGQMA